MQRFVDASAIGWHDYLYGNNAKANAMIKAQNPDITDDQIAFSTGALKKYGVIDFWRYARARERRDDRGAVARISSTQW